jgi:hypothetical protein
MRRYVPVVLPVLVIAAAYTVRSMHRRTTPWLRVGAVVAGLAMIAVPAVVTAPTVTVREGVPQLTQVDRICAAVAPHGAVVMVDGSAKASYGQTIRSYCNVPTVGLLSAAAPQLAAVDHSVTTNGRVLYVMANTASWIHWAGGVAPSTPFSQVRMSRWPSTLHSPPTGAVHETIPVYLGIVRADGLAVPVPTPPS